LKVPIIRDDSGWNEAAQFAKEKQSAFSRPRSSGIALTSPLFFTYI